jgi:hypothetical protein
MNHDEDYVKKLERTIARQQEQVDKYSMFIKRLDELNIKMSMQDCSQFLKPEAFIKWLESSSSWKTYETMIDAHGTTKRFMHPDGRFITLLVKYNDKAHHHEYLMGVINAFQHVWDMWMMEKKGHVISLIIDIMEYENDDE